MLFSKAIMAEGSGYKVTLNYDTSQSRCQTFPMTFPPLALSHSQPQDLLSLK